MSVLRTVFPIDATCAAWLDSESVSHPASTETTRFPTPRQITEVLHQLAGFTVSITADSATGEWSARIDAADPANPSWALLRVSDYRSDDQPHEFYFPNGWPEVIFTVVERLTHHCGPLVVVEDTGDKPTVVRSNDSIQALLREHEVA